MHAPLRTAICAVIIEHENLLIVENEGRWILPGGKPEHNESDITCMRREVIEELSGTRLRPAYGKSTFEFYKSIVGITPNKGDLLRAKLYFAELDGNLGSPSAEITRVKWMDKTDYNLRTNVLTDITDKIVKSLIEDRYL